MNLSSPSSQLYQLKLWWEQPSSACHHCRAQTWRSVPVLTCRSPSTCGPHPADIILHRRSLLRPVLSGGDLRVGPPASFTLPGKKKHNTNKHGYTWMAPISDDPFQTGFPTSPPKQVVLSNPALLRPAQVAFAQRAAGRRSR